MKRQTIHVEIPEEDAQFALARLRGIKLSCINAENFIDSLMLSCYQQGLVDGVQVAQHHPKILKLEWAEGSSR